ncbi:hypothetical protein F5Y08DRAFT_293732 [Xylaria arbuscula]|nr:hypothetical protein F5Y08DRAFT_293732 [Xylaria arbuscula]
MLVGRVGIPRTPPTARPLFLALFRFLLPFLFLGVGFPIGMHPTVGHPSSSTIMQRLFIYFPWQVFIIVIKQVACLLF